MHKFIFSILLVILLVSCSKYQTSDLNGVYWTDPKSQVTQSGNHKLKSYGKNFDSLRDLFISSSKIRFIFDGKGNGKLVMGNYLLNIADIFLGGKGKNDFEEKFRYKVENTMIKIKWSDKRYYKDFAEIIEADMNFDKILVCEKLDNGQLFYYEMKKTNLK